MAAPLRTDPIEHRATFDWLKRSANRNTVREGALANIELPLGKATTLALDRMCLLIEHLWPSGAEIGGELCSAG